MLKPAGFLASLLSTKYIHAYFVVQGNLSQNYHNEKIKELIYHYILDNYKCIIYCW